MAGSLILVIYIYMISSLLAISIYYPISFVVEVVRKTVMHNIYSIHHHRLVARFPQGGTGGARGGRAMGWMGWMDGRDRSGPPSLPLSPTRPDMRYFGGFLSRGKGRWELYIIKCKMIDSQRPLTIGPNPYPCSLMSDS